MTPSFSIAYNSGQAVGVMDGGYTDGESAFMSSGGWSYTLPMLTWQRGVTAIPTGVKGESIECSYLYRYSFLDSQGQNWNFGVQRLEATNPNQQCVAEVGQLLTSGVFTTWPGITLPPTGTIIPKVSTADGTVYLFSPEDYNTYTTGANNYTVPSTIEDKNGNVINISIPSAQSTSFSITDTLGRAAITSSGFGASGNTISISGLASPYTVTWGTASFNFPVTWTELPYSDPPCLTHPTASGSNAVITTITLPNGKQYKFSYNSTYGTLSKITYPTGGWVEYTWGINSQSAVSFFANEAIIPAVTDDPYAGRTAAPVANACVFRYDKPVITQRQVSFDGTNVALTQTFTYSTSWDTTSTYSWDTKQTKVKNTTSAGSFTTTYNYTPDTSLSSGSGYFEVVADGQRPLETSVVYGDLNGNTLKTVTQAWANIYQLQS
jgi:hypothetical protein